MLPVEQHNPVMSPVIAQALKENSASDVQTINEMLSAPTSPREAFEFHARVYNKLVAALTDTFRLEVSPKDIQDSACVLTRQLERKYTASTRGAAVSAASPEAIAA